MRSGERLRGARAEVGGRERERDVKNEKSKHDAAKISEIEISLIPSQVSLPPNSEVGGEEK